MLTFAVNVQINVTNENKGQFQNFPFYAINVGKSSVTKLDTTNIGS